MTEVKISPHNQKLGNIPSLSLPSIKSCPGHTNLCASICYAHKIETRFPKAREAYELNLISSMEVGFVESMVIKLTKMASKKKNPITTFRWHVSGDIPNIHYLYNMEKVMNKLPNLKFYAYTRNWTIKNWLPHLETLRKLPNFTLIASLDDEHITNSLVPPSDWRVAYVGKETLQDITTLIGRKFISCPNQTNQNKTILCDACKYCFNPLVKNTTHSVYFIIH